MKKISFTALSLAFLTGSALACAPSPSCYIEAGPAYLKAVCRGDVGRPIDPKVHDEPEKVPQYIKACKKLGFDVRMK